MMLVINKMSAAAGDEEQKIASYKHSLAEALNPYRLDEFPIRFIDAKDYCEGVDENDDFLIDISQFDTFVLELNHFVERRAALAKFDTPVRIVLNFLDEAQIGFTRGSGEDTAFLEVLTRLSRRVNKERERLRTKIKSLTLEMSALIVNEGNSLALSVGSKDFEQLNKQSEINVRKHYEQAGRELEVAIERAVITVQSEVEAELQSDLTQAFVSKLNFSSEVPAQNLEVNIKNQQMRNQVELLQKIGEKVGVTLRKAAAKELTSTASQGFIRSMDVAGSSLHQAVYAVGKFVGFKFKPWQAVGIAKNIGNAAMFLGPALAIVSVGMDLHTMGEERKYEQQMADIRRDITSQFQKIAIDLEQQIGAQLREFEAQTYHQIDQKIAEARQQTEGAIAASNAEVRQLASIRGELDSILQDVQKVAQM